MSLFDCCTDEPFKAAIHGALLVLVVECCAYNALVCRRRGDAWNRFSVCAYAAGSVLEVVQIYRHVRAGS